MDWLLQSLQEEHKDRNFNALIVTANASLREENEARFGSITILYDNTVDGTQREINTQQEALHPAFCGLSTPKQMVSTLQTIIKKIAQQREIPKEFQIDPAVSQTQ